MQTRTTDLQVWEQLCELIVSDAAATAREMLIEVGPFCMRSKE